MKKLIALAAFGTGYVFGTKAGRQRYDQIRGLARKAKENPKVQQAAHQAADLARDKGPAMGSSVRDFIGEHRNGGSTHTETTFQPDPEAPLAPESAEAWHATSHRA